MHIILNVFKFINTYIQFTVYYILTLILKPQFKNALISLWTKVILNFKLLNTYYIRNEHLWLDGFLFDFLQKKTADI
jgi:hypothetical protein